MIVDALVQSEPLRQSITGRKSDSRTALRIRRRLHRLETGIHINDLPETAFPPESAPPAPPAARQYQPPCIQLLAHSPLRPARYTQTHVRPVHPPPSIPRRRTGRTRRA